jgi:hypothetical protein
LSIGDAAVAGGVDDGGFVWESAAALQNQVVDENICRISVETSAQHSLGIVADVTLNAIVIPTAASGASGGNLLFVDSGGGAVRRNRDSSLELRSSRNDNG